MNHLGSFTFILHTHLPYVLHHGKWPHGSDWLSEAVAECYVPILRTLESLAAEELHPKISIDFSPIVLEQLADPEFPHIFSSYCDEKIRAAEENITHFNKVGEEYLVPLAVQWKEFYEHARREVTERDHDLLTRFRHLASAGILDPMTCAATHGYLPLLLHDANIRAQLRAAIQTHEEYFGKKPRGIWLPECAYRPRGNWSPTVGPAEFRRTQTDRAGLEELLAECGLEYFVVDGALTRGGRPQPTYSDRFQALHEQFVRDKQLVRDTGISETPNQEINTSRSLAEIYWVGEDGDSKVRVAPAVFSRDPESSSRVWSAELGYPGAGVYLDFHKKHHRSGLRYWAVTGAKTDLAKKQTYNPDAIEAQIDWDATDFVATIRRELRAHASQTGRQGIIAAPFDTELFGHWWFEGPRFLKKVLTQIAQSEDITLTNCADAIDSYVGDKIKITLPEGSWGEGGMHYVWTNSEVAWMWDLIYPLEDRFLKTLARLEPRAEESELLETILKQAGRELLLLESSDWQFVISTRGAIDYAESRFNKHAALLRDLLTMAERTALDQRLSERDRIILQEALVKDAPFANLNLKWWL